MGSKSYKQNNMQGAYQLSRIYAYAGSEDLLDGQKSITLATEVLDNGGLIKAAQVLMSIYGQGNLVAKDVRKADECFLSIYLFHR
ncbi:hypothetical protein CSB62_18320 [Vibrio splendidus]|nr:hypothetical protein CSB62_18320 [Vibrio splendidus]